MEDAHLPTPEILVLGRPYRYFRITRPAGLPGRLFSFEPALGLGKELKNEA